METLEVPKGTHPLITKVFEAFCTPKAIEITEEDRELISKGETKMVSLDQGAIAYSIWGSGPRIVLIHGWGGSRAQLGGFIEPLIQSGYEVHSFDFLAHGDSTGTITNIFEMARSLDEIFQRFGPFEASISHSFGTLVTSYLLEKNPQMIPNRMVYLASLNRFVDTLPRYQALAKLSDRVTEGLESVLHEIFGMDTMNQINNEQLVEKIDVPSLMVHDKSDIITPYSDSLEIKSKWPKTELITTTGLGHRGPLRDEGVIKSVLDFIKN